MLEKLERLFDFGFETKTENFSEKKVVHGLRLLTIYVIIFSEQFPREKTKGIEGKEGRRIQFSS